MDRRAFLKTSFIGSLAAANLFAMGNKSSASSLEKKSHPNIVLIYGDDIGYGDLGCYGATGVQTPNVDRLAKEGIKFTNAYATSATCTPSRYSMLSGQYAWRKKGTGILPGDAGLILDTEKLSLPSMLKSAGYKTGVVGKWHLGLGDGTNKVDWNGQVKPGPLELGFDYSFLIPATNDRVPCVYLENHNVVNLDPVDPIQISYKTPIEGGYPPVKNYKGKFKVKSGHHHDGSVINGIGRIGFMSGGKSAIWRDEDMADTLIDKANAFIQQHKDDPFFLYYSANDIHCPRVPHERFVGETTMGPRGDALVQFDWQVGQILDTLDRLGLKENTLVILSSDNGSVLYDGYLDGSLKTVGDHKPAGPLRGGKYSVFDGGTRVPFVVRWPEQVRPAVSDAFVSQVDLIASLANLTGQQLTDEDAPDSLDILDSLLGKDSGHREYIIEHSVFNVLSIRVGDWKYIEPSNSPQVAWQTGIESGSHPKPQLYNLKDDIGEKNNLAPRYSAKVEQLQTMLTKIKDAGRTRM